MWMGYPILITQVSPNLKKLLVILSIGKSHDCREQNMSVQGKGDVFDNFKYNLYQDMFGHVI